MERGSHWWNEPPRWAWIVMVVGSVALAVMLPFGLDRTAPASDVAAPPAETPAPSASPTAPASTTPAPAPAEDGDSEGEGPRIAVVGDGYASGTPQGGLGPDGWPALLERRIEGADVDVAAAVGAGYVAAAPGVGTLGDLAGGVDLADADVVVVLGSPDDAAGIADQVAAAATDLYATVAEQAPDAQLVVVGPVWTDEAPPAGVRNNRDVLQAASEAAGAVFVDPLADAWLVGQPALLGGDGVYPTDEGHRYLADRLEPAVRGALPG